MSYDQLFLACMLLNELEFLAKDEPEICVGLMDAIYFRKKETNEFVNLSHLVKTGAVSLERQRELNFDPSEEKVICPVCGEYSVEKRGAAALGRSYLLSPKLKS